MLISNINFCVDVHCSSCVCFLLMYAIWTECNSDLPPPPLPSQCLSSQCLSSSCLSSSISHCLFLGNSCCVALAVVIFISLFFTVLQHLFRLDCLYHLVIWNKLLLFYHLREDFESSLPHILWLYHWNYGVINSINEI